MQRWLSGGTGEGLASSNGAKMVYQPCCINCQRALGDRAVRMRGTSATGRLSDGAHGRG